MFHIQCYAINFNVILAHIVAQRNKSIVYTYTYVQFHFHPKHVIIPITWSPIPNAGGTCDVSSSSNNVDMNLFSQWKHWRCPSRPDLFLMINVHTVKSLDHLNYVEVCSHVLCILCFSYKKEIIGA